MEKKQPERNDATGANPAADTPIMKQYHAAKARYPRHLLFFRVGDFYEMFFDDAKTAARALGLTLTARNKGVDPIPMAGVPAHTAEQYLARLLRQGFSVAVCDQTEDAAQAKGLVKREVTRVVTPGTVLEENLLDARKPNRLVAILPSCPPGGSEPRTFGLASVDLASGVIFVQELQGDEALRSEFARLAPTECLIPEDPPLPSGTKAPSLLPDGMADSIALSRLKTAAFDSAAAQERMIEQFAYNGRDKQAATAQRKRCKDLPLASAAAGALLGYINETFAGGKVLLSAPQPFDPETYLTLGESAIRSLELIETLRTHSFEGSLLWSIDRTCTGAGSRCLREWLVRPLRSIDALRARHDAVEALLDADELRAELRNALKNLADLERIAARLSANRATPRDLVALRESIAMLPKMHESLDRICGRLGMLPADEQRESAPKDMAGDVLAGIKQSLTGLDPIGTLIGDTLKPDCSNVITDGGLINPKVDAELDRLQAISTGGKEWIAAFQAAEAERSGINSLKIGYNRVFGYFIEISRANQHLVPKDYERRQTLTNAERYTTPALKEREAEVLGAEEKICLLEQKLFLKLREEVAQSAARLHATGQALAALDALCSLAEVAQKKGHVRPVLNNSGRLVLEQMVHPVLQETLPKGELVPNDISLLAPLDRSAASANGRATDAPLPQIILLTGPNMAGKSTYIRCAALCVIMAQMGAFVPADRAEIGVVDRIFTRVGAADDLAGGRSTFMVEMTEVAEILSACSARSLLILDEVGRGTSTYDGVSLAWSLIEHLHQGACRPRTLFATHYHELCALEEELPRVRNASASVKEWQGEITFLHRIVAGPSERSFGIHVARLAGLPASLLDRARAILAELESSAAQRVNDLTEGGAQVGENDAKPRSGRVRKRLAPAAVDGQLQLFEPNAEQLEPAVKQLLDEVRLLDPQSMTPLDALNALDKLVKKAKGR
jgi:DNA mismatch repair protein MutS